MLSACVAIIKKGKAVDWRSAAKELPLATSVVIVFKGTQIVVVGAIKRERKKYGARISKHSGIAFPPETVELGYVAIDPGHRRKGLCQCIVSELLLHHHSRLFATTDDEYMKKTLMKAGFVKKARTGRVAGQSFHFRIVGTSDGAVINFSWLLNI